MARTTSGTTKRRRKRLLFLVALGGVAWYARSRRASAAPGHDPSVTAFRPAGSAPTPAAPAAAGARTAPGPVAADTVSPSVTGTSAVPTAVPPAVAEAAPGAATGDTVVAAPPAAAPERAEEGGTPALPDGSPPGTDFTIKGNTSSMLFHTPSSPYYGRTKAEVWFRTAAEARAGGFTEWTPRKRASG